MYQDINIRNPIFLSSFIFIILSLLLIYRKQNYFAKVRILKLQIWHKKVPQSHFFILFSLQITPKSATMALFSFLAKNWSISNWFWTVSQKLVLLAPTTPHLEFSCQNRPFLAQIYVLPLKSSCPAAPCPTYCLHSFRCTSISFRTLFNCNLREKIFPSTCSQRKLPKC